MITFGAYRKNLLKEDLDEKKRNENRERIKKLCRELKFSYHYAQIDRAGNPEVRITGETTFEVRYSKRNGWYLTGIVSRSSSHMDWKQFKAYVESINKLIKGLEKIDVTMLPYYYNF